MVDYSKWDKIQLSDDEDEDEPRRPTVTKVQPGQRINIHKSGWETEPEGTSNIRRASETSTAGSSVTAVQDTVTASSKIPLKQDQMGALSVNGELNDFHCWSQTKDEVTIQVEAPEGIRARDLVVTLEEKNLKVAVKSPIERVLFSGTLLHPAVMDEDLGWELLNWPLESDFQKKGSRRVQIILQKRILVEGMDFNPGESVVLWWRSLLEGGTEIDLTKIEGRKGDRKQMQEVWAEAQEMFRQKVKDRQPVIIDPDDC